MAWESYLQTWERYLGTLSGKLLANLGAWLGNLSGNLRTLMEPDLETRIEHFIGTLLEYPGTWLENPLRESILALLQICSDTFAITEDPKACCCWGRNRKEQTISRCLSMKVDPGKVGHHHQSPCQTSSPRVSWCRTSSRLNGAGRFSPGFSDGFSSHDTPRQSHKPPISCKKRKWTSQCRQSQSRATGAVQSLAWRKTKGAHEWRKVVQEMRWSSVIFTKFPIKNRKTYITKKELRLGKDEKNPSESSSKTFESISSSRSQEWWNQCFQWTRPSRIHPQFAKNIKKT